MQPPQNPYNQPPLANPSGGAPYGVPNVMGYNNDSGTGPTAVLPPELRGINWGAFLLNWIWSIGHSTWIGLLCLVPCVGTVMAFVLLFKGNEYAWQNRRWESIEQFKEVQKKWTMWGVGILVAYLVLVVLQIALIPRSLNTTSGSRTGTTTQSLPPSP